LQLPFLFLLTHFSQEVKEKQHSTADERAAVADAKL